MRKKIFKVLGTVFSIVILVGLIANPGSAAAPISHNPPGTVIYNLWATDGYWPMADGTRLYSYGYVGGRVGDPFSYINSTTGALVTPAGGLPAMTSGPTVAGSAEAALTGNAQFPAPLIWAREGDVVQINLKNLGVANKKAPNDPHTIHLHGLDVDAANDGVPETSVAGVPANAPLPGAGNIVVYMFAAEKEGTYMYHCHQEADIHVTMGMYGALVIYPQGSTNTPGQGGTLWGWDYDREYIMLLSDTDMRIHASEAQGAGAGNAFNMVNYLPQYWFVNGLSFPQTIRAGFLAPATWANWKAAHPGMDPFIQGVFGEKVLLRVINLGFETQPMHVHGFHPKVLGGDQREWPWVQPGGPNNAPGVGLEKNTLLVGSGETYELLFSFDQQNPTSTYPDTAAGTQTRYDNAVGPNLNKPVVNTDTTKPAIPDPFAPGFAFQGGPTVGASNQGPGGLPVILADTSQYFPFHNHDDYKATNNGVYPGGQFTMVVVRANAGQILP